MGCLRDIARKKTESQMLVGETGSKVSKWSSVGDMGRITLAGDVIKGPRSRDGGSRSL